VLLPVPADNSVDSADALKIVVTVAANTVVSATATGAKIVAATATVAAPVVASAGSATFSANSGSGTTVTLYAFTTSTTAGSVVVTVGGDTTTYVVKGTAGSAYNLSVVAPATVNLGGTATLKATTTDVFGNAVTNATITTTSIRGSLTAFSYDSTDKVYKSTLTAPATAGNTIIGATITAAAVDGLAKPVTEVVSTIVVADLADQVAVLTAALATAKADLAKAQADVAALKAAEIKKYNALATKWNKKFPKAKVALRK
jgi:hypothetical protein